MKLLETERPSVGFEYMRESGLLEVFLHELYRSYGFDVVTVGNAIRDDVADTVVIDRIGNEVFANRTAEIIRASLIDLQVETQMGVDVTVVLGEDFDGRYVR